MPTFSEIEITFIQDFELNYNVSVSTSTSGAAAVPQVWDWVASRSSGFEVTIGTPTATAGETTAINFKAAFDLDNPTGYVTTLLSNVLTIAIENPALTWVGFNAKNGLTRLTEGVEYSVLFNNYNVPIDNSNIEFALVKSPHYVNIPFFFETTVSVTLEVSVWSGDLTAPPATPTYSLTIPRPTVNFVEFNINLSDLIGENLEYTPTIDLSSTTQIVDSQTNEVKWIKYTAIYLDASEIIANIVGTFVAVDGYGFYNEGANPTKPVNNVLTLASIRKVARNGFILFPFVNNGTITSIDIDSNTGQINATETITAANQSTKIVQYLEVDVSQATTDEYITITTSSGVVTTYEVVDECRYNPIQVIFKNKLGSYDCITLFKKSNESSSSKSDEFVNNYISGGSYNTTKHQYQKLNVTAKKTIKANSGYINQIENTLYEQLLYSDTVYFYENSLLVPVNVKTSSLEYKTRVNDKLVNYELDFEYAYNIIQNV